MLRGGEPEWPRGWVGKEVNRGRFGNPQDGSGFFSIMFYLDLLRLGPGGDLREEVRD